MSQTKQSKQQRNIVIKAGLLTLASFIVLTLFYILIVKHELTEDKERYGYIARNQAEHITTTVDCVMSRTNTLKTMVKENNGGTDWFDDVAEDIYVTVKEETGISLKNFAIAPNGVVSDVYPLAGNEQLIGFDFLDTNREGNLEAKEAYENGKTIITNPFELIQGGIGMGGRAPVLLKNGESRTLWGLVTVTIDFDNLMEVIGLENLHGMGVDYVLSYIDPDGNEQYMYGCKNLVDDAVKTQFKVRNLTWVLTVQPTKGWISVWYVVFSMFIILLMSLFVGIITYMLLRLRESNALLLRASTTDALTGCHNRRAYEDKMTELSSHELDDDFVYVSADLNGLKVTNDTLGHAAGDELISGATYCLKKGFGRYGNIYRIGGDEFTALICADEKTLAGIKENLNSIINNWRGQSIDSLSISIGYASHREFPDLNIEELGKSADQKMYEAKREHYRNHDRRQRT